LAWKGVSGNTPFSAREGISEVVKKSKLAGEQTIVVENHTRVARNLEVQTEAIKFCESHSIRLLHAAIPNLFTSKEPTVVFLRDVLGAASQLDHDVKVSQGYISNAPRESQNKHFLRGISNKTSVTNHRIIKLIVPVCVITQQIPSHVLSFFVLGGGGYATSYIYIYRERERERDTRIFGPSFGRPLFYFFLWHKKTSLKDKIPSCGTRGICIEKRFLLVTQEQIPTS